MALVILKPQNKRVIFHKIKVNSLVPELLLTYYPFV